jgi:hypothetical protein
MYLVRAVPGSCGDIVTSVIDSTGVALSPLGSIEFSRDRNLLKKHKLLEPPDIMNHIERLRVRYKSISSQYTHPIESILTDPKNTNITIKANEKHFDWCIARLKLFYPRITFSKDNLKSESEAHYKFSKFIIELDDIMNGRLLSKLDEYKIPYADSNLYNKWLALNTKNFPYNFV